MATLALVLIFLMQPVAGASSRAEPALARTVTLPAVSGRIDHLAYDPVDKRLFVAALANGSLEVIDLEKGERVQSVAHLKEPQGIIYVPGLCRVIVACGGDGRVLCYDAASLQERGSIGLGEDADNVRLDGDGPCVLVAHSSGAIARIDAGSMQKVAEFKVRDHPEGFAIEPGGARIFANIPGGFIGGGGAVAVIDAKAGRVTDWTLKEAGRNFPIALDVSHRRLLVGCRRPARLLVMDTETGKLTAHADCVGDADDIFVDNRSRRVMVVGGDRGGAIDVFQCADDACTRVAHVRTSPGARTGLFVPERKALYVAVPAHGAESAEIREYLIPE